MSKSHNLSSQITGCRDLIEGLETTELDKNLVKGLRKKIELGTRGPGPKTGAQTRSLTETQTGGMEEPDL